MNLRPLLIPALALVLGGPAANAHIDIENPARHAFDPAICRSGTFEVYFSPDQVALSRAAKAQIAAVRPALSGCRIKRVSVAGLSDLTDDALSARAVSRGRADAVAAALGAAGVPRGKLHVFARGVKAAGDRHRAGDLMQRRALVTVLASPL